MRPLNILTWHVHGNYLYYLSHIPHTIYLPVSQDRKGDYMGKGEGFPWGENIREINMKDIPGLQLDCILFQRDEHYLFEQYKILSPEQLKLPKIYLEHDPPQKHPTDTKHVIQDSNILVVHVTHFNQLMWDNGHCKTIVIPHGVVVDPKVTYQGDIPKGLVVINNLNSRGRRLGADVYECAKKDIPLSLIGMGAEEMNGIGEVSHHHLNEFESHYRFIFNPIRYTSLGLSICEAMMIGVPIVGLATTEMVTTIKNGVSGYVDTDINRLIKIMNKLLNNWSLALRLSRGAKRYALRNFNIQRFVRDWDHALKFSVSNRKTPVLIPSVHLPETNKDVRNVL